jgi:hypothetical protein
MKIPINPPSKKSAKSSKKSGKKMKIKNLNKFIQKELQNPKFASVYLQDALEKI